MITPMFGHRPKPKKFKMRFQHYDPKEDERKEQRIKIKRSHKKYHQGRSVIMFALGIAIVFYLMFAL